MVSVLKSYFNRGYLCLSILTFFVDNVVFVFVVTFLCSWYYFVLFFSGEEMNYHFLELLYFF